MKVKLTSYMSRSCGVVAVIGIVLLLYVQLSIVGMCSRRWSLFCDVDDPIIQS